MDPNMYARNIVERFLSDLCVVAKAVSGGKDDVCSALLATSLIETPQVQRALSVTDDAIEHIQRVIGAWMTALFDFVPEEDIDSSM